MKQGWWTNGGVGFARYAMSELTIAEFCIVEGVSVSSFYLWRKRLAKKSEHRQNAKIDRSVFAPVRLVTASSAPTTLVTVQLPGGTRLEIPMSDCEVFERTIQALIAADAQRAVAPRSEDAAC